MTDYSPEEFAQVPEESFLGVGSGNPVRAAALKRGESVVDLGSGAGVDAFLAARAVGPEGRVVGVDMTPEMLERATKAAITHGFRNVLFRAGRIEDLPIEDASADVVLSNCVINLSPEKERVLAEAYRVLRPGGRFVVSDTLHRDRANPPEGDHCGCIAGALTPEEYEGMLRAAGFEDVDFRDVEWQPSGLGRGIVLARKPTAP